MLKAMAGRDLRDWAQGAGELASLEGAVGDGLEGKRIGYWSKPPAATIDPEVAALIDAAVGRLAAAGAVVECQIKRGAGRSR